MEPESQRQEAKVADSVALGPRSHIEDTQERDRIQDKEPEQLFHFVPWSYDPPSQGMSSQDIENITLQT